MYIELKTLSNQYLLTSPIPVNLSFIASISPLYIIVVLEEELLEDVLEVELLELELEVLEVEVLEVLVLEVLVELVELELKGWSGE